MAIEFSYHKNTKKNAAQIARCEIKIYRQRHTDRLCVNRLELLLLFIN